MGRERDQGRSGATLRRPLAVAGRWVRGLLDEHVPHYCQTEIAEARRNGWEIERHDNRGHDGYCRRCGATVAAAARTVAGCPFCVDRSIAWDRITRLGPYSEPLDRWIVAMKFGRRWSWGAEFGKWLEQSVGHGLSTERTLVCPVPMHWWRRIRRGYNQAELIADAFARQANLPVASLLRRVRYTRAQTSVPVSQRAQNVRRSFSATNVDLTGWTVWLVDDVKTTGATLNACAQLLGKAGAGRIYAAVVAVADPRGADFQVKW